MVVEEGWESSISIRSPPLLTHAHDLLGSFYEMICFPALSGALRLFFLFFFFFSTALLLLHCYEEAEPVFTIHRPMFDATRNSQNSLFDSSLADRSPCRLGLGGIFLLALRLLDLGEGGPFYSMSTCRPRLLNTCSRCLAHSRTWLW